MTTLLLCLQVFHGLSPSTGAEVPESLGNRVFATCALPSSLPSSPCRARAVPNHNSLPMDTKPAHSSRLCASDPLFLRKVPPSPPSLLLHPGKLTSPNGRIKHQPPGTTQANSITPTCAFPQNGAHPSISTLSGISVFLPAFLSQNCEGQD